jgi:hypothetical protein
MLPSHKADNSIQSLSVSLLMLDCMLRFTCSGYFNSLLTSGAVNVVFSRDQTLGSALTRAAVRWVVNCTTSFVAMEIV